MEFQGIQFMDPSLYKAAESGNVDFLKKIRDGEASVDILFQTTPKNNNVLHIAAQFKPTVFFKEFPTHDIRSPPLFWATNNKGDTPMHVAARVGCVKLVEFLIDHAKKLQNTEATDLETGPADAEAYKELLRMTNSEKDTAFHVAVKCGHRSVVIRLVDADPELCCFTTHAKESPLFLAISKGFPKIASYILDKSPTSLSFDGINGVTALHAAVTRKSTCKDIMLDIVKTMVSKHPEMIREVDELGWTPLHYAAFKGNVEAITSLIQHDSSAAYILDKYGMSALHVAAYAGRKKVMKELIRLRPDTCDLLNRKGQTILHAAVLGERLRVVVYILTTPELAGLVNEADNDGNTPLLLAASLAASKQNIEIMAAFAGNRKVDKTATNNDHSKAADIFIGDYFERKGTRFAMQLARNPLFLCLGRSIGVPFFHRCVRGDFQIFEPPGDSQRLESPVDSQRFESPGDFQRFESPGEKEVASTAVPIANNKSVKSNLLDDSKKFDTNLLVAMLIATVTFAAAFTMPGGLNSDGMAILHRKIFFLVFVLFDTISFSLSMFVVFFHFMTSQVSRFLIGTHPCFIRYSIVAMVVAFGSGMIVVLPKHGPVGLLVILICSPLCFIIILVGQFAESPAALTNSPISYGIRSLKI